MLSKHVVTAAVLVVAVVGCGKGERAGAVRQQGTAVAAGEVAAADLTRPVTRAELTAFAALPSRMDVGDVAPSAAMIALGRRLYHEPVLSDGHDVSCNTCHPLNGYGADGRKVSFGDLGHSGNRNAPTVYNAAGQIAQFWDGRAPTVEAQAVGPILNPAEMAMPDSTAVLTHMRTSRDYEAAFRAAFPSEREPITYANVGRAIGAFERGLVTPGRWDRFLAGDSSALTADEQRGLATFVRAGCSTCHYGAYVGGATFQKLGVVKPWPALADSGRYAVTKNAADLFLFKVPTLRNIEKTGPYFHDGSVAPLDSAIRMMARHQLGRELTAGQVSDIHTFLSSLTGEIPAAYIAEPPRTKADR